jgi:hypothetical protein
MADDDSNLAEPPYKKNLERLASLQDRLSKVQKTAESLLATVSGTGDYTDKVCCPPCPFVPPANDSPLPLALVASKQPFCFLMRFFFAEKAFEEDATMTPPRFPTLQLVYTDVTRAKKYLDANPGVCSLSYDSDCA